MTPEIKSSLWCTLASIFAAHLASGRVYVQENVTFYKLCRARLPVDSDVHSCVCHHSQSLGYRSIECHQCSIALADIILPSVVTLPTSPNHHLLGCLHIVDIHVSTEY